MEKLCFTSDIEFVINDVPYNVKMITRMYHMMIYIHHHKQNKSGNEFVAMKGINNK